MCQFLSIARFSWVGVASNAAAAAVSDAFNPRTEEVYKLAKRSMLCLGWSALCWKKEREREINAVLIYINLCN